MRNINVVAKKMARNGLKIANLLGCAFCFESDFSMLISQILNAEKQVVFSLVIWGAVHKVCLLKGGEDILYEWRLVYVFFYFSCTWRTVNCSDDGDWISCGCVCSLLQGWNFERWMIGKNQRFFKKRLLLVNFNHSL